MVAGRYKHLSLEDRKNDRGFIESIRYQAQTERSVS